MKKKRIWKGAALGVLVILLAAVLLQTGRDGRYTDADGAYKLVTVSDSWAHIYKHPVWDGNGKEMFSVWGNGSATNLTSFMSIRALSLWCGWDADEIVDGFNALLLAANRGDFSVHGVYSQEEIAADPALCHARLALYRGQPGKPLAIVAAGGGYRQVVSMVEGFPYAAELYRQGYSVAVLRYRVGEELGTSDMTAMRIEASKDLTRTISYLVQQQDALGISMDGYTLFGSSAGGGLITLVSFDEYARRNAENAALPRPATINLIYTDRFLLYNEDGSADLQFDDADKGLHVFAIVGEGDAYGGDWVLDRKIPEMKAVLGDDHVIYHKYSDYPHGGGLGVGTSAEGWMEQAITFWNEQK